MHKKFLLGLIIVGAMIFVFGCGQQRQVKRFGSVIGLKEDQIEAYKDLHSNTWPGVLKRIRECNIRNYSIYLTQFDNGNYYLFGYFEYVGDDFEADMQKMADDPVTQDWWKHTNPMQIPLESRAEGDWWKPMEEVFHTD